MATLAIAQETPTDDRPPPPADDGCGLTDDGYPQPGCELDLFTFDTAPVPIIRNDAEGTFVLPDGSTHRYEVIHLPEGGVNWVQARALAKEAGGYLATVTSQEEADFLLSLVADQKYWHQWDETHSGVMNGPFLGGYQPAGAETPSEGWQWVTGEPFEYTNWAYDGMPGDEDPRPNDQPNDANGNQNVMAMGEVNIPVSTWGDFPYRLSSYQSDRDGAVYALIFEYEE